MGTFPPLLQRIRPRLRDVVGIDLGASGIKAARIRRDRGGRLTLLAADLLPPLGPPGPETGETAPALSLPRPLQAPAAALCFSSPQAVCKLLTIPGGPDKVLETNFAELLGLPDNAGFRCGHRIVDGESRTEAQVLAVGVPERQVAWVAGLLAKGGPAPWSAELAGLAAMSSYLAGPGAAAGPRCDLVVDGGASTTTMAIFFRTSLIFVRSFGLGSDVLARQVMRDLNVDEATAREVLDVGSIDVRASVRTAYENPLRQLAIAMEFAERRSGQRLQKVFLSGGMARNSDWRRELQAVTGLAPETWNPWEGMAVAPGAVAERAGRPGVCFAAAAGAALDTLLETT